MKFTTVRIEGAVLSADILDKIEQGGISGQLAKDFGFDAKIKVKDEIARAWADAQDLWRIFNRQKDKVADDEYGTTETRRYWMLPLLGLLGYDIQLSKAAFVNGKSYAISHRSENLDRFPVHIVGFNDSLDKKRDTGGTRMSPHALAQEYINLNEHLYAIVTNGIHLRLLRDSSRLIKLSFIEFDLQTMMDEEHFADFAIMYRLLHISRMPAKMERGADSLIEKYHQDALESGSRIRDGLSRAVEFSIRSLAGGFLEHPENELLRTKIESGEISSVEYYQYQLRLIYRILFLLVIEERNLVFPENGNNAKRDIYREYYSVNRLRQLCDKPYILEQRYQDLWIGLKHTFQLFDNEAKGKHLGINPLAGDLFGYHAIGFLNHCHLHNRVLLECLKNLSVFQNKITGQKMRVNYAALNVEEFGSVYEGLLEYAPVITTQNGMYQFELIKGSERSSSGSHYTPDELVQPLIKHSLDHIIKDNLNLTDKPFEKEQALLSIKVCDVACGSGHILLNAARRIGTELSKVRTGEDQPSPKPLRQAIRDVIKSCIYGVDKNPLAVDLCKVALWLEAHNPGEPLNFLDHHIKCGDAIVGLAHKEELENGIADEAFKKMPDDDKEIRAELAKQNKQERASAEKKETFYKNSESVRIEKSFTNISEIFKSFNALPEDTIEQIENKRSLYAKMTSGENWLRLKTLADIQTAQFFIPKTPENQGKIITDDMFRQHMAGIKPLMGSRAVAEAMAVAAKKRFFHWFLEFPVVFAGGGFDCILGNPPFLGGRNLTVNYGSVYSNFIKTYFPSCAGNVDLVAFFFLRAYSIIAENRHVSYISTKTVYQGETRKASLEQLIKKSDAIINFALRSKKWPGKAAVIVCLIALCKKKFGLKKELDGRFVDNINSYLESGYDSLQTYTLLNNLGLCFKGSEPAKGFMLSPDEAESLKSFDEQNVNIIYPYLNGNDLNSSVTKLPSRFVINFFDWPVDKAKKYKAPFELIQKRVKKIWDQKKDTHNTANWWWHRRRSEKLYNNIKKLNSCLGVGFTSKYAKFSFVPNNITFSNSVVVVCKNEFDYFVILNSSIHEFWAWRHCSTMGDSTLRYTPSAGFESFPFPQDISSEMKSNFKRIGMLFHEYRWQLMQRLELSLTKTYNLFHQKDLSTEDIIQASKQPQEICESAYEDVIQLRELQKQMDEAVLQAYVWSDIDLAHDFYEVDYLPENDRIRYTISPEARKEVLKRLLKLNHEIHEQELLEGKQKKGKSKKKSKPDDSKQLKLFQ